MFTVAILVNGQPIFARSAVNQTERNDKGETRYRLDSGHDIWHRRSDGAIGLARKLLDDFDTTIDHGRPDERQESQCVKPSDSQTKIPNSLQN